MERRFVDKIVLVTGAASGIGAATARRFAREGARLVLGDLNEVGLATIADELRSAGADVDLRAGDVSVRADVEALVQAGVDHFGGLDVLFNNAGTGMYGRTPDLEPDAWEKIIAVDLHSVFYGCRAAIPHLRRGGGGAGSRPGSRRRPSADRRR